MRRLFALTLLLVCTNVYAENSSHNWQWRAYSGGRYFGLFKDNVQVGCWRPEQAGYVPLRDDGTWGEITDPPVPIPDLDWMTTHGPALSRAGCREETIAGRRTLNFGMDYHGGKTRYSINGRESSQQEVLYPVAGRRQRP